MRFLISLFLVSLFVTACESGPRDPDQMARGFIAYEDQYKSAPGPEAKPVGYAYETQKNRAVLEDMRYAAADLVAKLDQNLTFNADKIYLAPPIEKSTFYTSFDYLLRDELVKSGFMIAPTPQGVIPITFTAQEAGTTEVKTKPDYRPLSLSLVMGSRSVSGIYEIPAYDFKPTGAQKDKKPTPTKRDYYPASLQRID